MANTASLYNELAIAERARAKADADLHEAKAKGRHCPGHVLQNAARRLKAAETHYQQVLAAELRQEEDDILAMVANRDYSALDAYAPVC